MYDSSAVVVAFAFYHSVINTFEYYCIKMVLKKLFVTSNKQNKNVMKKSITHQGI